MAITEQQKQLMIYFFAERLQTLNSNPTQFSDWLYNFFMKSKDDQLTEFKTWLDNKKIKNTAQLNSLDAQKIAASEALNNENNLIDGLKQEL